MCFLVQPPEVIERGRVKLLRRRAPFLQEAIGEELLHLEDVGYKLAQRPGPSADINLKGRWILLKVVKPALSQKICVREQVSERDSGPWRAHGLSLQRASRCRAARAIRGKFLNA